MKLAISFLFIVGLAVSAAAQDFGGSRDWGGSRDLGAAAQTSGGGTTYLLREKFENAFGGGYDVSGWHTNSGAPNPTFTGTVLQGAHSLDMPSAQGNQIYNTMASANKYSVHFLFQVPASFTDFGRTCLELDSVSGPGNNVVQLFVIDTTFKVRLLAGTGGGAADITTTTGMTVGTTYHIWMDWDGGAGTATVCFSTSATKPTSDGGGNGFATTSSGVTATAAQYVMLQNVSGKEFIFDDFILNNSPIGSNP